VVGPGTGEQGCPNISLLLNVSVDKVEVKLARGLTVTAFKL